MILNSIILSISSSIDSLGIGITYGIRNTKISFIGKFILLIISIIITYISLFLGNFLKLFLPDFIEGFIGSGIFIFFGSYICFQSLKCQNDSNIFNNPISSDLDNSNTIDSKESLLLAIALSLDSFCIGICGSIININLMLFPIFVSIFQLIFLSMGIFIGRYIHKFSNFPENIWSLISGILLIIFGIFKFFC
jgi:putative Mn2+ efflux pump MntP